MSISAEDVKKLRDMTGAVKMPPQIPPKTKKIRAIIEKPE